MLKHKQTNKQRQKRMSWWKLPVRQILAGRHGGEIHGVTEVVLGGEQVSGGLNGSRVGPG